MSARVVPELMLTVEETAAVMKISKSYAKKLIAAGTVPSVRVGRCRRVRLSELQAHIAALPTESPADEPSRRVLRGGGPQGQICGCRCPSLTPPVRGH